MRIYRALEAVNHVIEKCLSVLTGTVLAVMSITVFLQVIFRYVLKSPLSWSEELATYLFTIETFLGAAMVLRKNKHIRVTFFVKLIKNENIQKGIAVITDILMVALCMLVCVNASSIVMRLMKIGQASVSMPWLKTCYIYIAIPVSMGIMALVKLESILNTLFCRKE